VNGPLVIVRASNQLWRGRRKGGQVQNVTLVVQPLWQNSSARAQNVTRMVLGPRVNIVLDELASRDLIQ